MCFKGFFLKDVDLSLGWVKTQKAVCKHSQVHKGHHDLQLRLKQWGVISEVFQYPEQLSTVLVNHSCYCTASVQMYSCFFPSRWTMETIPSALLCPRHAQTLPGACQLVQAKTVPEVCWQRVWATIYTPVPVSMPLPKVVYWCRPRETCHLS